MTDGHEDRAIEGPETGWLGGSRELAVVYAKGFAMGAADTVPGVSGGTIALVTGIYERLIDAIADLDPRLLGEVRHVHRPAGRRRLLGRARETDLPFLAVLGLGVLTAVVALSRLVHAAIRSHPAPTNAFFLGLIAAAAVVLYGQIDLGGLGVVTSGAVGFLVAFVVSGASGSGAIPHSLPVVFASGAVAVTAMVLPGISGAFILLLLGQYTYLTGVLSVFVDAAIAAATGGTAAGLFDGAAVVGTFGLGAVVGVVTVAHAIRRALDRHRPATLAFLVSLMVGSLRLPVREIRDGVTAWTPGAAIAVLGAAAVGAGAVLLLDRYTSDLEYAPG